MSRERFDMSIYEVEAMSVEFGLNPEDPMYSKVHPEAPSLPDRHHDFKKIPLCLFRRVSSDNTFTNLPSWLFAVLKEKKTESFKDILPLLDRANMTVGIQELAQLGQEDIVVETHDVLDHGENRCSLGVRLDVTNTILDALVRSLLVLCYTRLVQTLVRLPHTIDLVLEVTLFIMNR
jgi:hypothetical protein